MNNSQFRTMAFNSRYLTGTCFEVNLPEFCLNGEQSLKYSSDFLENPFIIKMLLELKVYMDSVWRKSNHSYNGIGLNGKIFAVTMVLFYEAFIFTF